MSLMEGEREKKLIQYYNEREDPTLSPRVGEVVDGI